MYFLLMECQTIRKGGGYWMRETDVHGLNTSAVKFRIWNLPLSGCSERLHTLSVVNLGVDTRLLGKVGTTTMKNIQRYKSNHADQSL